MKILHHPRGIPAYFDRVVRGHMVKLVHVLLAELKVKDAHIVQDMLRAAAATENREAMLQPLSCVCVCVLVCLL